MPDTLPRKVILALIALCGVFLLRSRDALPDISTDAAAPPTWRDALIWIALAAVPSALLIAITAHISTDIAAAPFLWVVPLALYLVTFVIAFQSRPILPHRFVTFVAPVAVIMLVVSLALGAADQIVVLIALNLTAAGYFDVAVRDLVMAAGAYTLVASKSLLEYSYGPARSASLPGTPGLVPGPGAYLGGVESGPPGTRSFGTHSAGDVRYFARMPLVVGESDVLDVGVTMRPTVTLRGRVEFEGDGDPPGPMTLIAEPADGSAWLGLQHSKTRPSPGETFEIEGLMPGEYVLRAVGLSPRQAIKSIVSGAIDYTTRPFDAAAGQDFDVVVTYTDRIASLTGRVADRRAGMANRRAGSLDPADTAPPISVFAFPASRDQWTRYWDADLDEIQSVADHRIDEEGRGERGRVDPDLPAAIERIDQAGR